jgi:hypothetical protein
MTQTVPVPLTATDRDEIAQMVGRIKAGAERAARSQFGGVAEAPVAAEDLDWAASQQLPREFFQFFEIQRS